MMPARLALALQADGWWLRSQMPWVKRSPMPESVTDRPASAVEYVFLLTRSARYFYDAEAVRQGISETTIKRWGDRTQRTESPGTAPDRNDSGGSGETTCGVNSAGRNFRNSDLFYSSLEPPHGLISGEDGPLALDVNPKGFPGAHFATFPPKLVEPCIKAGTSEKGCCPACGAPWVREVDRKLATVMSPASQYGHGAARNDGGRSMLCGASSTTLGWSPSCGCAASDVVPCTVLDPFGGAGTVALVADRLGRDAVLIEIKADYAAMAAQRVRGDGGLFSQVLEDGNQGSGTNQKGCI
jgi:DNA modification methylase